MVDNALKVYCGQPIIFEKTFSFMNNLNTSITRNSLKDEKLESIFRFVYHKIITKYSENNVNSPMS